MMERTADFYDEETSRWTEWFVRLFEPLLTVFIGWIIGVIVILMYIPISNWLRASISAKPPAPDSQNLGTAQVGDAWRYAGAEGRSLLGCSRSVEAGS